MTGLPIVTSRLVHIYHSEGHDVAALSGVDLHVAAGEFIGLLDPSGAGKSTLLSLLGGLFRPSAGRIHIGDHELSAVRPGSWTALRAREISLMLQGATRNLLPYFTPRENVEFAQTPPASPVRTCRPHPRCWRRSASAGTPTGRSGH